MRHIFVLALLALPTPAFAQQRIAGLATVADGDSLTVGGVSVRLFGIDAPEGRQTCEREGALREDIISEIYLEIREGRLHPREIDDQTKPFISAGFAAWANPWGDLSLSRAKSADGDGESFLEGTEDEQALAAFERVAFQMSRNRFLDCGWRAPGVISSR